MTEDNFQAPSLEEPPSSANGASVVEQAADGVQKAAHGIQAVYKQSRKPGMPLSILGNIAREAPLGSLLVAFLLGVAVARRR